MTAMDNIQRQQKLLSCNEKFNESLKDDVSALFEKHFMISNTKSFTLPKPEFIFKEQPWQQDELQTLKNNLNDVKNRLNNFKLQEWQKHTNQMNKARDVQNYVKRRIQPEFITQAWCKFYEIVSNYPLVPFKKFSFEDRNRSFISIHLCEAPGAFVVALNHWLKINAPDMRWNWIATTLNPYCEENPYSMMVDDDRFIRHTLKHWHFGKDNTGNLMDLRNLDALLEKSRDIKGQIMLVTADGSIDCTDVPGEQEKTVAHLQLCEAIACIHLLHTGGTFLLKVFTLFEHHSVCLMYLLSYVFHEVKVTKPATSKEGNSEMYVVCINFKGQDYIAPYINIFRKHYDTLPMKAMFSKNDIPNDFMQKIIDCSKQFKFYQCRAIEDNIRTFQSEMYSNILLELKDTKQAVVSKYIEDYNLKQINAKDEIVGREIIERTCNHNMCRKRNSDSYNERCKKRKLGLNERLSQIRNQVQKIKWPLRRLYNWRLRALPRTLKILTGKIFNEIHSSRFCEAEILRILGEMYNVLRDTCATVHFPITKIMKKLKRQNISNCQILNFQFVDVCDSHQTITKICDQIEKLQTGQTLILLGYCLLTQLNVNLLYILGNCFDNVIVEIHGYEGYCIKLKTYQPDEKVLNYFREILRISYNVNKENMTIWSVMSMTVLYEWDQFPLIIQLNHLFIKAYAYHLVETIETSKNKITS